MCFLKDPEEGDGLALAFDPGGLTDPGLRGRSFYVANQSNAIMLTVVVRRRLQLACSNLGPEG